MISSRFLVRGGAGRSLTTPSENAEHVLGRAAQRDLVAADHDRPLDQDGGLDHRPDERLAAQVPVLQRSEEHTSELQSLMRISYAVFCLKKKKKPKTTKQ